MEDPQSHIPSEYSWAGKPRRPSLFNPLGLPAPLTWKQKIYLYVPQCLMAACIDGGANFGIACAMYRSADQVRLWPLSQNTIAGDIAVTTFIQGIITFCVVSGMVNVDLRKHKVDPFPYPWPDTKFGAKKIKGPEQCQTKHGKLWRTFHNEHGLGRGLHFFSGSQVQDILDFKIPFRELRNRWLWAIWKGSVLSALFWFILWPISIAILAPLYGGRNMAHTWVPQIVKLLYGFILGLFQNPICAALALGSEDAVREHLRDSQKIEWAELMARGYSTTTGELVRRSIESPRTSMQQVQNSSLVLPPKYPSPAMTPNSKSVAASTITSPAHTPKTTPDSSNPRAFMPRRYSRSAIDVSTIPSILAGNNNPGMTANGLSRKISAPMSHKRASTGGSVPQSRDVERVKSQSVYDVRRSVSARHSLDSSVQNNLQTSTATTTTMPPSSEQQQRRPVLPMIHTEKPASPSSENDFYMDSPSESNFHSGTVTPTGTSNPNLSGLETATSNGGDFTPRSSGVGVDQLRRSLTLGSRASTLSGGGGNRSSPVITRQAASRSPSPVAVHRTPSPSGSSHYFSTGSVDPY